ncbi:MAG: hypothetical protein AAF467_04380 [Actinomycetota bacterium]
MTPPTTPLAPNPPAERRLPTDETPARSDVPALVVWSLYVLLALVVTVFALLGAFGIW